MSNLVWFRRDLRVLDNTALFNAVNQTPGSVIGIFFATPEQWKQHNDADCKTSFWLENLRSLSQSLVKLRIPLLIDGDLAANNGGWKWSASTGTDAGPYFRIFNPFSQSKRFDLEGVYIRTFCPELNRVPPGSLHDAEKLSQAIQELRLDYPKYIVGHQEGRDRALAAFKSLG